MLIDRVSLLLEVPKSLVSVRGLSFRLGPASVPIGLRVVVSPVVSVWEVLLFRRFEGP